MRWLLILSVAVLAGCANHQEQACNRKCWSHGHKVCNIDGNSKQNYVYNPNDSVESLTAQYSCEDGSDGR